MFQTSYKISSPKSAPRSSRLLSFAILGTVMSLSTGCFTSSREEAIKSEIRNVELKISEVEKQILVRDRSIDTVKSTSEDANRKAQNTRGEMEEIKRSISMTQGAIDELRVKISRIQEGAGKRVQEDGSSVKLAEVEDVLGQIEKRVSKLELSAGANGSAKDVAEEKKPSGKKETPKKNEARYKNVAELSKALTSAFASKDYKKVVALATTTLNSEPQASFVETSLAFRGEAHFAMQDYSKSALDFADLLEKFPKTDRRPRALLLAGDSFVYLKQPRVAKIYYTECVKSFPDREECKASKERLDKLGV